MRSDFLETASSWIVFFILFRSSFWSEFDPSSGWTLAAWIRHASQGARKGTGERGSNTWVTTLRDRYSSSKDGVIPDGLFLRSCISEFLESKIEDGVKSQDTRRSACAVSASWWGNGSPRLWRLGDLRGWPPPMVLRHGPYTYGWLQSRIFHNGRKPDGATPRDWWSP